MDICKPFHIAHGKVNWHTARMIYQQLCCIAVDIISLSWQCSTVRRYV